ncbi:S phase cyclin A-associated ER protein [Acrasis kona]|uniref:S phase cyclin A-associated ER protein n=1 Tax=Acrasis kona TaxID=1008807 RepID=A0AAW2ZMF5_9EUKA
MPDRDDGNVELMNIESDPLVSYDNKNLLSFRVAHDVVSPTKKDGASPVGHGSNTNSPKRTSAKRMLQLNDMVVDTDETMGLSSKNYNANNRSNIQWRALIVGLRGAIDQLYGECDARDDVAHCEDALNVLNTAVHDFHQLVDRIKKQEIYEKSRDQTSISWSLRKTISPSGHPEMPENVDLAAWLLAGIQFGQVSQFGSQYSTGGRSWADVSLEESPTVSPQRSPMRRPVSATAAIQHRLSSPTKPKSSPQDLKSNIEEKLAKAEWNRTSQQLQKQNKLMKDYERMRDVAERREEIINQKQKQTEEKQQQAQRNQAAITKKKAEDAKNENMKCKEIAFLRQMNNVNNELILEKKLEESELRRKKEYQKKIEKVSKDSMNQQAAKKKREEMEETRRKELEEAIKIKKEKEERLQEEKHKQVQIRSNKSLEMQKKIKQLNENNTLKAQQARQNIELKMEAVAHRKTLSLESKRSKAKLELTKVIEVIKRKESPIDSLSPSNSISIMTSPKDSSVPIISSPIMEYQVQSLKDQARKLARKKMKKIRQRLLSLKKKVDTPVTPEAGSPSVPILSKFKNPKLRKIAQDLQSQLRNNRTDVVQTLQELLKLVSPKTSLNDYEVLKQEECIDSLISLCTSESTSKLVTARDLSYQILNLLVLPGTTYLTTNLLMLPLLQTLYDVLMLPYELRLNQAPLMEIIGKELCADVKGTEDQKTIKEETINFMLTLGIPEEVLNSLRLNSSLPYLKLLEAVTQTRKFTHRDSPDMIHVLMGSLLQLKNKDATEMSEEGLNMFIQIFKILNNLCITDLDHVQMQLGTETFLSELSYVLPHALGFCCNEIADVIDKNETDVRGQAIRDLLSETILLIGFFTTQNNKNQEMVQHSNGRDVSLLQRLCSLPIQYFTDPRYKQVLMPTLVCICYENNDNKDILECEMSTDMLVSFIKNYDPGQDFDARFSFSKRFPPDLREKAALFFE